MTAPERPTSHPFNMYRHIHAQPDAIVAAYDHNRERIAAFAQAVAARDRLYVVGIGTSYHATQMMEYFMRAFGGGMTTIAVHAFDFVLYGPVLSDRDAVIVISHTGRKSYAADAVEKAKASDAILALVTGGEGAGRHAGLEHLFMTVEPEQSSTYTISYTSALGVLAAIAGAIGAIRSGATTLADDMVRSVLPEAIRGALATEEQVKALAADHIGHRKIWLAGGGPVGVTAAEIALKIKEASYLDAEGMSTEQMLHGPFQSVEPGDLMILLGTEGPGLARTLDLAAETREIGLHLLAISDGSSDALHEQANTHVIVPALAEPFSAMTTLVPGQLLAYWLSLSRGTNPDRFRLDDERFARAYALTKL